MNKKNNVTYLPFPKKSKELILNTEEQLEGPSMF